MACGPVLLFKMKKMKDGTNGFAHATRINRRAGEKENLSLTPPKRVVRVVLETNIVLSQGWVKMGIYNTTQKRFAAAASAMLLCVSIPAAKLQGLAKEVWSEIRGTNARFLLFDGIWSAVPPLRSQIVELAREHVVIVPDSSTPPSPDWTRATEVAGNVITVDTAKENATWIRLNIIAR